MGRPGDTGDAERRRIRERGLATLDYVGALVATSVVVALVCAVLVAPGGVDRVATEAREAVCVLTGGGECDPGEPGGGGSVTPVSGDPAQGDPAPGDEPPAGATDGGGGGGGGDDGGCSGFWGCTWSGIKTGAKQVGSAVYNVGKGAVDDVVGVWDLVTDPGSVVDAFSYLWENPGDAVLSLFWDDESRDMWGRGDYGGAIGRGIWNTGSWFIPFYNVGKGASKVGKFGRLGAAAQRLRKVGTLADDAGAAARRAEQAAAKGDAGGARRAADDADAKADDAEREARDAGCAIAAPALPAGGGGGTGVFGAAMPLLASDECDTAADDAARARAEALKAKKAAWVAALDDPYTALAGKDPAEVKALIPDDWPSAPQKKGSGTKYTDPDRPGSQVLVENGWALKPGQTPNVHHGPYLRVSRNGKIYRVPLLGNPDPGHKDPL